MKNLIANGNYCRTSYFTVNGCASYTIGIKEDSDDECQIYFEDGLYKLYKNNELLMAATNALIEVKPYKKPY